MPFGETSQDRGVRSGQLDQAPQHRIDERIRRVDHALPYRVVAHAVEAAMDVFQQVTPNGDLTSGEPTRGRRSAER